MEELGFECVISQASSSALVRIMNSELQATAALSLVHTLKISHDDQQKCEHARSRLCKQGLTARDMGCKEVGILSSCHRWN